MSGIRIKSVMWKILCWLSDVTYSARFPQWQIGCLLVPLNGTNPRPDAWRNLLQKGFLQRINGRLFHMEKFPVWTTPKAPFTWLGGSIQSLCRSFCPRVPPVPFPSKRHLDSTKSVPSERVNGVCWVPLVSAMWWTQQRIVPTVKNWCHITNLNRA